MEGYLSKPLKERIMSAEACCEFDVVPPPGMSPGDVGSYIRNVLHGNLEGLENSPVSVTYMGSFPFRKARIRVTGSDNQDHIGPAIISGLQASYWDIDSR
ncbi:MAG: hypothetical protein JXC85_06180 [Candidatus Aenigmarchaeota archaeon]|nr:hypothetical protein [Candidatus Aenigmarchaeota archaeon]